MDFRVARLRAATSLGYRAPGLEWVSSCFGVSCGFEVECSIPSNELRALISITYVKIAIATWGSTAVLYYHH